VNAENGVSFVEMQLSKPAGMVLAKQYLSRLLEEVDAARLAR
jgi:hypothetical protein